MLFSKKVQQCTSLRLLLYLFIIGPVCCIDSELLAQSTPHQPIGVQIIVVPSARDAQQILDRLNAGEDFATVAKQKSTDAMTSYYISVDESVRSYMGLPPQRRNPQAL